LTYDPTTMALPVQLPDGLGSTRGVLHRVAVHILARRRFAVAGRFGLRASPGGFCTPAFGEEPEATRVAGTALVREVGSSATQRPLSGATLRELATFVGADLVAEFDCGKDTPPVGDMDAPLALDPVAVHVLADWYALGWRALDASVAELPAEAEPAVIQLWPEHFDAGTHVALADLGPDRRVNLGVSPGDGFEDEPYLYVGPWGFERRAEDADYWNAPFGAVIRWSEVQVASDPPTACLDFLRAGLRRAADRNRS
jgi:hypothetical protein